MKKGVLEGDKVISSENEVYDLKEVTLCPPCLPTKIICIGLNYYEHAREFGLAIPSTPLFFLKPPTSLIGPMDPIIYPKGVKELHYEAELALVIKERCYQLKREEVKDKVLGYTCFNDVTARDLQLLDGQWTRSKSFDTFAPTGPFIVPLLDVKDLQISCYLNGKKCQTSSTQEMIFTVEEIVSHVSHVMTLLPGDIISTGTPKGVGPMQVGDVVQVEIEGIGRLTNPIISEKKEGKTCERPG